jgi:hypothetical protein
MVNPTNGNITPLEPNTKRVLRTARQGDLCILLGAKAQELHTLQKQQAELRSLLGGHIVRPVHLTLQRFEITQNFSLVDLKNHLNTALHGIQPFPVTALSFVPIHSDFRQLNLLKWRIEVTPALTHLSALIEKALVTYNANLLYPSGWISSLVTALEGIPTLELDHQLTQIRFPHTLFTACKIGISQVISPEEFNLLAEIQLPLY